MTLPARSFPLLLFAALLAAVLVFADARSGKQTRALAATGPAADVPLKDAKLNIEHNATDRDTGFQGSSTARAGSGSTSWARRRRAHVRGPRHTGDLGLTELFFETVEPANADVPINQMLAKLPAGNYTIAGTAMENGESAGQTSGTAWLTHDVPKGPKLVSPAEDASVPVHDVVARWKPVSRTITGEPVKIIAYQLIIEKDVEPHRHMIGKFGLSMYLPPSVTQIAVPNGFLEHRTAYNWEVLAIERSGNQTLSSVPSKRGSPPQDTRPLRSRAVGAPPHSTARDGERVASLNGDATAGSRSASTKERLRRSARRTFVPAWRGCGSSPARSRCHVNPYAAGPPTRLLPFVRSGSDRSVCAAGVAAPSFPALLDRETGDQEPDNRVEPPGAGERVSQQPDQHRSREVGAEEVLLSLAGGGAGTDPCADALLGAPEHRHDDEAGCREGDPDDAFLGARAIDQRSCRLEGDVGREDEELDRDELLRARLGLDARASASR